MSNGKAVMIIRLIAELIKKISYNIIVKKVNIFQNRLNHLVEILMLKLIFQIM